MNAPPDRPVVKRTFVCEMCGDPVAAQVFTSPHPEAPELVAFQVWPWVGFVAGEGVARMLVCCSIDCARELVAE
jgi:hypothetical protein